MRPSLFYASDFNITRDYTSTLREIDIPHYERLHFTIMRDWYSTLREITLQHYQRLLYYFNYTPAVYIYYRSILTADLLFSRRTLLPRPSLPSTLSPVYSYGAYATFPLFMRLIPTLWEIDILHYERLHSNITRDYIPTLREITLHHYEILL